MDAFERVAPLTGRYESILGLVWRELVRVIYSDYSADLPGSGARVYIERTPFFTALARQKQINAELREQLLRDEDRKVVLRVWVCMGYRVGGRGKSSL